MRKGELWTDLFRAYNTKGSENRAKPQDRDVDSRAKPISIGR